jgi:predicted nuclease of predicted toxin-antitoxin system
MRILIDECLNWRLSRSFTGHYAVSVQKMGWSGIKNGKLLALAVENKFDVFLTADRNLTFQQNLLEFQIAIVVLEAEGIRLHQTLPLIPKVMESFPFLKPGAVVRVTL